MRFMRTLSRSPGRRTEASKARRTPNGKTTEDTDLSRSLLLLSAELRKTSDGATQPSQSLMNHSRIPRLLPILIFLGCALVLRAENLKSIHPTGYVTDLAGVIAADTKGRLEALCYEVEQKAGAQMAIVTVRSLDGESIENYAVNLNALAIQRTHG